MPRSNEFNDFTSASKGIRNIYNDLLALKDELEKECEKEKNELEESISNNKLEKLIKEYYNEKI